MTGGDDTAGFAALGPDDILDAVEGRGFRCDGRFLALNSYENRVYQVGLDDGAPVIIKVYRPGRWSDAAIREEHAFTLQLAEHEIPVVPPLADDTGATLYHHRGFRFALYERRGGRAPDLDRPEQLQMLGRFIGRIHAFGRSAPFHRRPVLDVEGFAVEPSRFLLEHGWIPADLHTAYRTLIDDLLTRVRACFERAGAPEIIRLHGDCHPGNILWRDGGLHIVDFDDARMGPAVQDLWMFLSGDRDFMTARLADVLDGYTEFSDFDPRELHLIEALRTMRMIHYAAWIARRWHDPAFPMAFPWFGSGRYWEDHILALREQAAAMDEPPLVWA